MKDEAKESSPQQRTIVGRRAVVWTNDEENMEGDIIGITHNGLFLKTEEEDEEGDEYWIPYESILYVKFKKERK